MNDIIFLNKSIYIMIFKKLQMHRFDKIYSINIIFILMNGKLILEELKKNPDFYSNFTDTIFCKLAVLNLFKTLSSFVFIRKN